MRTDDQNSSTSARLPAGEAGAEAPARIAGTVAVVGFPNVGKSTLVNRLTASRAAVVHETPGVTRDRKELLCEWVGHLVPAGRHGRRRRGRRAARTARRSPTRRGRRSRRRTSCSSSSTRRAGITPGDEELAAILRAAGTPVIVVANKIDDPRRDLEALEFHRLGLGDPWPLSALHGHGTGDLLDEIVGRLPGHAEPAVGDEAIRVAILGRPNVGKSSLLNALVGRERVIVSDVPGTTRDAIDTVLRRDDTTFLLVDTAGLRRKRHQRQGVEYYSELRALEAAERADVALVLVDASQGVVEQDLAIADVARKAGCSTLVVLSKWDAVDDRAAGDEGAAQSAAAAASARDRRVGAHGPRARPAARPRRGAVRKARREDLHATAQPRARRAAGGAAWPAGVRAAAA